MADASIFRGLRSQCFGWYSEILAKVREFKGELEVTAFMGYTPDHCTSLLSALTSVQDLLRRWCRALRPDKGVPERALQPVVPIMCNSVLARQGM
jgi:hypothetical protein